MRVTVTDVYKRQAPHRQVPDHRVLRHAEQAQLLPPAQRSDVQAGHGVSPAVKGAGIGPLAAAAARADHRPLAIAQIQDVYKRQGVHGDTGL